ncbi:WD40-repeat-containing domain protein [Phlyctochytrium arcticum]|nr:WD40-repeat-containing domain protein [Phlyctochytrium arcticum]
MAATVTVKHEDVAPARKKKDRPKKAYRLEAAVQESVSNESSNSFTVRGIEWCEGGTAGGQVAKSRICFTGDSSYFMTFDATRIKIFNTTTGMLLNTLNLSSHLLKHSMTLIQPHPTVYTQVFTGSTDGILRLWNIEGGQLIQSWDVGEGITTFRVHPKTPNVVYLITIDNPSCDATKAKFGLVRLNLVTQGQKNILKKRSKLKLLDLALSGKYIVVTVHNSVILLDTSTLLEVGRYESVHDITALAVHPDGQNVAIGDAKGRITLWHQAVELESQNVSESLHWHPHAVNDLAYTSDGSHLLSGGNEKVLVIWQLAAKRKQFLPRLNSEILTISISPNQKHFALTHRNNTSHLVSAANFSIEATVAGLHIATAINLSQERITQPRVDARTHAIVLPGYPGFLQFFDIVSDAAIMQLEVTPNSLSDSDIQSGPSRAPVFLTQFALSNDSSWLLTCEERRHSDSDIQSFLKFWKYDLNKRTYTLFCRVDQPHDGCVNGLEIASNSRQAVTTGADGSFKIWQLKPLKSDPAVGDAWQCTSRMTYQNQKAQQPSFSPDSSILAIPFGHAITIWDGAGERLHSVLISSHSRSTIRKVEFVNSTTLVAHSDEDMGVWDLLTCTLVWSLRMKVQSLVVDTSSSRIAVLVKNAVRRVDTEVLPTPQVFVFEATSPTPLMQHSTSKAASYVAVVFHLSQLLLLTTDGTFEALHTSKDHAQKTPTTKPGQGRVQNPLSSLYGDKIDIPRIVNTEPIRNSSTLDFSIPSHIFPPPGNLLLPFLGGFLNVKGSPKVPLSPEDDIRNEDQREESSEETVEPTVTISSDHDNRVLQELFSKLL